MRDYVRPGASREAVWTDAPKGRDAGTITFRVLDASDGSTVIAEASATERPGTVTSDYYYAYTAPDEPGLYLEIWRDAVPDPDVEATDEIEVTTATVSGAWRPEVDDVAALLRARTKDLITGDELGTFVDPDPDDEDSPRTRPTATGAASMIDRAVAHVLGRAGGSTLDELATALARTAIALRAAMFIELSYFPEAVEGDDSAYARLEALYDEALGALLELRAGDSNPATPRFGSVAMGTDVDPFGCWPCVNDSLSEDLQP